VIGYAATRPCTSPDVRDTRRRWQPLWRGSPDNILGVLHVKDLLRALHAVSGDAEKIDIGVVEGIVGNRRWDVSIEGFANHAGTTPMNQRRDALLAAARLIEAVNRVAASMPGQQVATVGRIEALPGAYNVIAGKVTLGIDLRDLQAARMDSMFD